MEDFQLGLNRLLDWLGIAKANAKILDGVAIDQIIKLATALESVLPFDAGMSVRNRRLECLGQAWPLWLANRTVEEVLKASKLSVNIVAYLTRV